MGRAGAEVLKGLGGVGRGISLSRMKTVKMTISDTSHGSGETTPPNHYQPLPIGPDEVRAGVARELHALAEDGRHGPAALARAIAITAGKIRNSPVLVEHQAHPGQCHACGDALDDSQPVVAVMQAKGGGPLWLHHGGCCARTQPAQDGARRQYHGLGKLRHCDGRGSGMTGLVLGIDLGAAGAVSLLDVNGHLLGVRDLPVLDDGPRARPTVSASGFAEIVREWQPERAVVEFVASRPTDSPVSAFAFGMARATVMATLEVLGVSAGFITVPVWKRIGGDRRWPRTEVDRPGRGDPTVAAARRDIRQGERRRESRVRFDRARRHHAREGRTMTSASDKPGAFATIADRLGKLLPRLASEHDGEIIATVDAIRRTLTGAGLDLHDLAQRAAAPTLADIVLTTSKPRPAQPTASRRAVKPATGFR